MSTPPTNSQATNDKMPVSHAADDAPLLQVRDLVKRYPVRGGILGRTIGEVKAVDGVGFDLKAGECLSLVGESGSGKTTAARCILRAIRPTAGKILFNPAGAVQDLAQLEGAELKAMRRHIQMIFQDPNASLNPRMTVEAIIAEPLLVNRIGDASFRRQRVRELMHEVGLRPAHAERYPHAFSGGQRQRIGIARALALQPRLIVADEAVSALDVSVQAQVLNLLQGLQQSHGLTYLFITHDLSVVRHISDRVAVMYLGRLMELAPVESLFNQPLHPYTEALLAAVPQPNPRKRLVPRIRSGDTPDPANPPKGCPFHPRCPMAEERCRHEVPAWREHTPGHHVACHLYPK